MIEVRLLSKSDNRKNFSCGNIELDYFFQKFAGQNQFKNYIGTNYVAIENENILGFISVSSGEIYKEHFLSSEYSNLPYYPLPILRISRLGVVIGHQKSGIGQLLMKHVLELSLEQKRKVGCFGVVVDSKDEAKNFYSKLGFIELQQSIKGKTSLMFLAMKVIEKAL